MGYRSDVRIITSRKGYDKLKEEVNKYNEKYDIDFNLLDKPDVKLWNDGEVYLGWNSIKWYEYSGEGPVKAIMNGLSEIKEDNYSYSYARLGEDATDYEEEMSQGEEGYLDFPQLERYFNDDEFEAFYGKDNDYEI